VRRRAVAGREEDGERDRNPRDGGGESGGKGSRPRMSCSDARALLGVGDNETDFKVVVQKKNALLLARQRNRRDEKAGGGDDVVTDSEIEEAYDVLLMQSLSSRSTGAVADPSVRYADVRRGPGDGAGDMAGVKVGGGVERGVQPSVERAVQWLQRSFPFSVGSIERMPANDALRRSVAFVSLLLLSHIDGFYTSSFASSELDHNAAPGAEVTLALALASYFVSTNTKSGSNTAGSSRIVSAFFVCLGVLFAGCLVGDVMGTGLRSVGVTSVLGVSNSATVVGEFGIASLWLASLVLY